MPKNPTKNKMKQKNTDDFFICPPYLKKLHSIVNSNTLIIPTKLNEVISNIVDMVKLKQGFSANASNSRQ